MTTVTGMTADRMLAIEGASVVDGDVVGDNLILTKHDGTQINAGSVRGAPGPQGPVGSDLIVLDKISVLDVGLVNQIRAGRQLTAADFTNMGLSAPLGLWNLSDLSDVSGNGRNLLNKGAISFDIGINGVAATAGKFTGQFAQALYIPDTGAADPFRIKTGSIGCWFKTPKRATDQAVFSKELSTGQMAWQIYASASNVVGITIGYTANGVAGSIGVDFGSMGGISDSCDDRWHFAVATMDALNVSLYVDGVLEARGNMLGPIYPGSGPLNIGSRAGDASTTASLPFDGRVDEAFITADVLSEDQVRNLYCTKIPHTLAAIPSRASLNVRRRKRGATLVAADFPTQPLRLHNFSGGSLGDEGSGGVALVGSCLSVAGVDGSSGNALAFSTTQSLSSTDTGLPAALATRSFGCWFKTIDTSAVKTMLAWGVTPGSTDARAYIAGGTLRIDSGGDNITGPFVSDGLWHFVVAVEDNTAVDGIKRKAYLDGRLIGISTVLNPITLGGANVFRVGAQSGTANFFIGQLDAGFVCGYALTFEQIATLYAKGSQALTPSPKNVGDHVEGMDAANLLAIFDMLESQHQVDLRVAA